MDLNLIWRIRTEIWNFSPTFLSHFIIYKIRPHPLLHPAIFSWSPTNLMPWKAASYEKKCLCLRKRKVFYLELKRLYLLSNPKHTFLMTLVLLGNTYKKIKVTFTLHLHYKKTFSGIRPPGTEHLHLHILWVGFHQQRVNSSKVYCSPHYSELGFSPFGPFCCLVIHPKRGGGFCCS